MVVEACKCPECWGISPQAKQRWFRAKQERTVKDLLQQIRAAATGRGASMSKILILLVHRMPSHLIHGVPAKGGALREDLQPGEVEVFQPGDDMSDGERYAVRTRVVSTRLVLRDSVLPETIGEEFHDGTTGLVPGAVPDHPRGEGERATNPTGAGGVPQPGERGDGPGSGSRTGPKRLRESVVSGSTSESTVDPRGPRVRALSIRANYESSGWVGGPKGGS